MSTIAPGKNHQLEDGSHSTQNTKLQIMEMEYYRKTSIIRDDSDTLIWLLVLVGVILCFPVGFLALYYFYTAPIEYYPEDMIRSKRRAKIISMVAIMLGILWIGALFVLTVLNLIN